MPKKPLFSKDDYFRQLDEMLMMPGVSAPSGQQGSLLGRIRQAVQKRGIANKAKRL